MKSYNQFVAEAVTQATIFMNRNVSGSGLFVALSEKEQKAMLKALHNHSRSEYELMDFLEEIDDKVKYTETLSISFDGYNIGLYASGGRLRIAAGGSLTEPKLLKKMLDIPKLIKAIPLAKIKG